MSTSGETADLMVREGIQITESAVKLAGLGAKNLAALLIALANDNQKLSGKTNLKRLIHDGEELTIFSLKQEDLKGFHMESRRYGVLYYPIVNKVENTGTVEIMAKAKDARQINRIFERMGPNIAGYLRLTFKDKSGIARTIADQVIFFPDSGVEDYFQMGWNGPTASTGELLAPVMTERMGWNLVLAHPTAKGDNARSFAMLNSKMIPYLVRITHLKGNDGGIKGLWAWQDV